MHRGDIVRIETYFSADGRLAARREWSIQNALTGEQLGRATRSVSLSLLDLQLNKSDQHDICQVFAIYGQCSAVGVADKAGISIILWTSNTMKAWVKSTVSLKLIPIPVLCLL